jgi:hypothetical protein
MNQSAATLDLPRTDCPIAEQTVEQTAEPAIPLRGIALGALAGLLIWTLLLGAIWSLI